MICVIKNNKVFAIHSDNQVAEIRNKYDGLDIIHIADDTNVTLGGTDPRDSGVTWKDARLLLNSLELDSPFRIKSAFYTSGTDTLSIVIASGTGETFNNTTINTITKTTDTTLNIPSPLASTTYTIYLKNDGNFASSTDGSQIEGSLLIGTISTNADKTVNIIVDKRPLVSGVGKKFAAHLAETTTSTTQPHGLAKNKLDATIAPTVNDDSGDGYSINSVWCDVVADKAYVCLDATIGAAVWKETTGGAVLPTVPACRVYHDIDQSIAHAANTKLAFNNERFDTDNIHDNATNNTRLTCKTAGKYMITANAAWEGNSTGCRRLMIYLNNTTVIGYTTDMGFSDGATLQIQIATSLYNLSVNDYVEVLVYQESGGALSIKAVGNYSPEFMMVKVG